MTNDKHVIIISAHRLSDDSHVYNVRLGNTEIPAITMNDAYEMARAISDAILRHSNDTAIIL